MPLPLRRYRFGVFEADASTGELRRQGIRVRLNAQPFQVLLLLLEKPGELVTREDIARQLWGGDTFVDAEHGVHSAINRIREALHDTAAAPRYVETLARRGYRFIAAVERIDPEDAAPIPAPLASESPSSGETRSLLASPDQLPRISASLAQTFFVLFQLMYVGFYVGALANLAEIQDLVSALRWPNTVLALVIVTAALLIPVRAFVTAAVLLRAPAVRHKFLRLWPFLLPFDELWALSPFLLLHHINFGLALACTTLLVYSPFAQRSLVLMGAGDQQRHAAMTG